MIVLIDLTALTCRLKDSVTGINIPDSEAGYAEIHGKMQQKEECTVCVGQESL